LSDCPCPVATDRACADELEPDPSLRDAAVVDDIGNRHGTGPVSFLHLGFWSGKKFFLSLTMATIAFRALRGPRSYVDEPAVHGVPALIKVSILLY
jgi:hypothetical protein